MVDVYHDEHGACPVDGDSHQAFLSPVQVKWQYYDGHV
jgi:hypothetical protein